MNTQLHIRQALNALEEISKLDVACNKMLTHLVDRAQQELVTALQTKPAQGEVDVLRWQDEYDKMPEFAVHKFMQDEIDALRVQHVPIHFILCRILQDHLIEESECSSVDFEAVYSRKTEQELADEINKRLTQRAASGDAPAADAVTLKEEYLPRYSRMMNCYRTGSTIHAEARKVEILAYVLAHARATPAPIADEVAGDLTDPEIVQMLASLGIDATNSKYGFPELQVSTNVPGIRNIVVAYRKALAARPTAPKASAPASDLSEDDKTFLAELKAQDQEHVNMMQARMKAHADAQKASTPAGLDEVAMLWKIDRLIHNADESRTMADIVKAIQQLLKGRLRADTQKASAARVMKVCMDAPKNIAARLDTPPKGNMAAAPADQHEAHCSLMWPATLGTEDDQCDCAVGTWPGTPALESPEFNRLLDKALAKIPEPSKPTGPVLFFDEFSQTSPELQAALADIESIHVSTLPPSYGLIMLENLVREYGNASSIGPGRVRGHVLADIVKLTGYKP